MAMGRQVSAHPFLLSNGAWYKHVGISMLCVYNIKHGNQTAIIIQPLSPYAEACMCMQARGSMVLFVHGRGSAIMQAHRKPTLLRHWLK